MDNSQFVVNEKDKQSEPEDNDDDDGFIMRDVRSAAQEAEEKDFTAGTGVTHGYSPDAFARDMEEENILVEQVLAIRRKRGMEYPPPQFVADSQDASRPSEYAYRFDGKNSQSSLPIVSSYSVHLQFQYDVHPKSPSPR